MSRVVPEDWLPTAGPKRVVVHWTGGGRKASSLDQEHYHIIVQQDLKLVRGVHSIRDNDSTADGDYAAHALNCNTRSVGVSLCGMLNAQERPFIPGPHPITEAQWDLAAKVVAEVCECYDIPITPQTVLQHGEIAENLGIPQRDKWDVCRLPWKPEWTKSQVCGDFRRRVQVHLSDESEKPIAIKASVAGHEASAFLLDSQSVIAIRPLEAAKLLTIEKASNQSALLHANGKELAVTFYEIDGKGYVPARKIAQFLGLDVKWDSKARTLTLA